MPRKLYTREFKIRTVALLKNGKKSVFQLAKELNIPENKENAFINEPQENELTLELRRLRSENARLKEERDPKKSCVVCQGKRAIYAMIKHQSAFHSVENLCRVLDVSRSGYYEWLSQKPSEREKSSKSLAGKPMVFHGFKML